MKALVTGGAGFIGSNLAEELSKKHEVVIIDDLSTGRAGNVEDLDLELVRGSITDPDLLKDNFRGVDYVFHQAALPSVQRSIEDPVLANEVNVCGTLNVLVAARDADVKKVIYASSSSVYGDTPELPKQEDMKPDPKSPYAVAKLAGEYYCRVFNEIYGLKTVALRYFNVYGPRQDPSSDYAAVTPKFITSILINKPPTICADGEQSRDFTFVRDVVHANILACRASVIGVFNIACGERITVNELADKINEIVDKNVAPVHAPPRKGDVRHSFADISKAKKILGYKPKYGLGDGLEETIEWFANGISK